ncbi:hypothetical protein QTP88_008941 [Uroleucon formosanum]
MLIKKNNFKINKFNNMRDGSKNDIFCFYKKQNNERTNFNNNQNSGNAHGIDWARAPPINQILNSSCKTVLRRCHVVLAINENYNILCLNS